MAARFQRAADPSERRQEILDAARELFRENGLSRTTYGDVAARLGITRGLVYHYFPTRDHLVEAALDQFTGEVVAAVADWDAARNKGHVAENLRSAMALLRRLVSVEDPFARDLDHPENARAYALFLDRVVEAVTDQIQASTVQEYEANYGIEIAYVRETFLVLIYGLIALVRSRPDISDDALFAITWQTLHLREPEDLPGRGSQPPGITTNNVAAPTER